jgi:hypothetical protein
MFSRFEGTEAGKPMQARNSASLKNVPKRQQTSILRLFEFVVLSTWPTLSGCGLGPASDKPIVIPGSGCDADCQAAKDLLEQRQDERRTDDAKELPQAQDERMPR